MLNYVLKLKANPDNPAYNCVFKPDFEDLHDVHKNEPKPLSLRVRPLLQAAGVDINSVEESVFPATPPWTLPIPEVRLDLTSHKKAETPDPVYFHGLQQILADFPGFRRIFTDGSKSEDGRVGAAAVMDDSVPVPSKKGVFTIADYGETGTANESAHGFDSIWEVSFADAIIHYSPKVTEEEFQAFRKEAASQWEHFLVLRARELKPE
nr:hypothetical protein BaRGS_005769 [Batillaria attramentaria]